MRLKGTFKDAVSFTKIIHAISRMSSQCVLRFSPEEIRIVVSKGIDAVETWALLEQTDYFSGYRVESNYANEVNLEVSTDAFHQVLRSACASGSETVMKLAKRNNEPMLCLEIETTSASGQVTNVTHHVPIKVKKPADMERYKSAEDSVQGLQAIAVSLFPPTAEVRSVAERMKSLEPDKVVIGVNGQRQVKLAMSNDTIKIETVWNNLPKVADTLDTNSSSSSVADPNSEAAKRFRSIRVDLKAFLKMLSFQLPEHKAEFWIYQRVCATFVFHIKGPSWKSDDRYPAHIMVHLPRLGSD